MNMIFCHIIVYTAEALILLQYSSNLFILKYSRHLTYIFLMLLYSLLFFIFLLDLFWLNAVAFPIINFIFIFLFYDVKWTAALFHSAVSVLMMSLGELIMGSIFPNFLRNFYEIRFDNISFYVSFAFMTQLLYFIPMYLLSHFFQKPLESRKRTDKAAFWVMAVPLISIWLTMTLLIVCHTAETSPLLDQMITISAALVLFLNLIVWAVYSYMQNKSMEFAKMQLQLQKENDAAAYYKMLLKQTENQNILIHDIKNHLQSIAQLSREGKADKVNSYINEIVHSFDLQSPASVCDNEFLNIILCRYLRICAEQKISFQPDIRSHAVDFLTDSDLTGLFCNLLDNAVESAKKQPDSFIKLTVIKKQNTAITVLTMTNTCCKNPFTAGNKLVSTKGNCKNHGFGMKSVERIVKNYGGDIKIYYKNEDKTFHTILTLKSLPEDCKTNRIL